jgi:spore germination cell wall hydrolase CwlJ-like protein
MAMAVKREAGGESLAGQRAVLDVIYSRMRSRKLKPCQVIAQPGQFSFYQGRIQASKEDLRRLERVARMHPVLVKATHFHTLDVQPAWAEKFQRLAVIGGHVFYKGK